MAKRITELSEHTGRPITYTPTRKQRKAARATLIPFTAGPQTRLQKFIRDAVG
jgi:hypothetical protein